MTNITVICSEPSLETAAQQIASDLSLPFLASFDESYSVFLMLTPERLQLQTSGADAPGPVYVDFIGGALGHRLKFGGGRRQLIGRAVGVMPKETLNVLDVTAGLGRDAYILANIGCDVTMIERSPVVAALLADGLTRATKTSEFAKLKLRLIKTDAAHYLQQLPEDDYPDVVYLDPMFPPLKKSAMVKKEMRVLKQVAGEDDNSAELFSFTRRVAKKRVVVKRHRHAPTIDNAKPDLVFNGKSSRFDVYLTI